MHRTSATAPIFTELVRLLFTLALTATGYVAGRTWMGDFSEDVATTAGAMLGAGVGYVVGGMAGRLLDRLLRSAPDRLRGASGPELFAGTVGFALGVFIGGVAALPAIVLLPVAVGWPLAGLVVLVTGSLGGRVFACRAHDLLAAVGLRARDHAWVTAPDAEGGHLIDSSAAIDGRVLELSRAGLISGRLVVPEFVIDELQGIADSGDKSRRRRGRRGLDVLDALRDVAGCSVVIDDRTYPGHDGVDAKLVALGIAEAATLVTTDHNLAKAAGIRGVRVLNPHALGESLRPVWVTGDRLQVAVERRGSEAGQGVGFLDDGTMVVVDGGAELVGETVEVEIGNSLRTAVGRLVFARPLS